MLNFKEIIKAWLSVTSHTPQQGELAKMRLDICAGCTYKKELFDGKYWSAVCGKCGCPLKAKIFSDATNPCPMGFWKKIDAKFGLNTDEKDTTTFI
jgi:hypothetical protein